MWSIYYPKRLLYPLWLTWQNVPHISFSCRDFGEHGFLVEGSLPASKKAVSASIPYKYVVYRNKKETYEYEYIYKMDSTHTTNRCLFVKPNLINDDGKYNFHVASFVFIG